MRNRSTSEIHKKCHNFTYSGKTDVREIKEFKEAKQSTSSDDRTTPQPVSERSFLILVEKKISDSSGLHFISLSLLFSKKLVKYSRSGRTALNGLGA